MNRRHFLLGASLAIAAPAIIRTPGLLMPVKPLPDLRRTYFHAASGVQPLNWHAGVGTFTFMIAYWSRWSLTDDGSRVAIHDDADTPLKFETFDWEGKVQDT